MYFLAYFVNGSCFLPIGIIFKLKNLWRRHATSELSTKNLLAECANMYTKYNTMRYASNVDDDRECESEKKIDIVQRLFLSYLIRCNAQR